MVGSLKALQVLPAEPAQLPVVLPAAPNNGMMEYWIIGIMETKPIVPPFHYSTIPIKDWPGVFSFPFPPLNSHLP